jgi:hypothetical protein
MVIVPRRIWPQYPLFLVPKPTRKLRRRGKISVASALAGCDLWLGSRNLYPVCRTTSHWSQFPNPVSTEKLINFYTPTSPYLWKSLKTRKSWQSEVQISYCWIIVKASKVVKKTCLKEALYSYVCLYFWKKFLSIFCAFKWMFEIFRGI